MDEDTAYRLGVFFGEQLAAAAAGRQAAIDEIRAAPGGVRITGNVIVPGPENGKGVHSGG